MSYTKHNFVSGDTLLASDLNAMEDQIAANEQTGIDLKSAVNDPVTGLNTKAPVIIDTASGAIASFDDGADGMPLKTLTVNIEPVQSGTGDPSHENVRPITGWTRCKLLRTGQNLLCDKDYTDGATAGVQYTKLSDGSYLATGTITDKSARYLIGGNLGRTFKPGKYQASCDGVSSDGIRLTVAYVQRYGQSVKYIDITTPNVKSAFEIEPTGYIYSIYFRGETNGTTVNTILKPLLMFQVDTETGWVPYVGETYPITFPSPNPGTVYGGTLDVVNKRMTSEKQLFVFNGGEADIAAHGTIPNWFSIRFFAPQYSNVYVNNTLSNFAISNQFIQRRYADINYAELPTQNEFAVGVTNGYLRFVFRPVSIGTLEDFKAALIATPVQVLCNLINDVPFDIVAPDITTLLGENNIWADCGDVTVEYPADTKLYIQKINAPTDDDMIADARIESGKYFLIGNTLYLSTTVIPAGDTIIPGTNCTKSNLAEALNALNT